MQQPGRPHYASRCQQHLLAVTACQLLFTWTSCGCLAAQMVATTSLLMMGTSTVRCCAA